MDRCKIIELDLCVPVLVMLRAIVIETKIGPKNCGGALRKRAYQVGNKLLYVIIMPALISPLNSIFKKKTACCGLIIPDRYQHV
jgi:hypothetical protein